MCNNVALYQVTEITVMVRYPPSVQLKTITSDQAEILKEGMQLKLICQAEGNPTKFRYKWTVDGDSGELVGFIHIQHFLLSLSRPVQPLVSGGVRVPDPQPHQGDAQHGGGLHCLQLRGLWYRHHQDRCGM